MTYLSSASLYDLSCSVSALVISLLGFVGNLLVFCVYCRKRFAKNSLRLYFMALTVTNSLLLTTNIRVFVQNKYGIHLELMSDFFCKIFDYLDYIFPSMSAWTMVIISFDRMVKVVCTRRFKFLNAVYFQVAALLSLYVYICIMYMPVFLFKHLRDVPQNDSTINESVEVRSFPDLIARFLTRSRIDSNFTTIDNSTIMIKECLTQSKSEFLNWVDMVNLAILPFILMTCNSLWTILHVSKSRCKFKSNRFSAFKAKSTIMSNSCQKPFAVSSIIDGKNQAPPSMASSQSDISTKKTATPRLRYSKDAQFVVNSIALNLIFLLLTLPLLVLFAGSDDYENTMMNFVLATIAIDLFFLNFASLVLINLVSNSVFRAEFLLMFCRKSKNRVGVSQNKSSAELILKSN